MLKHFRHLESERPADTLYREGKGDVLDVQLLLTIHFGSEALLPKVNYFSHKLTELAPPKAKAKAKGKKQYFGPAIIIIDYLFFFCS